MWYLYSNLAAATMIIILIVLSLWMEHWTFKKIGIRTITMMSVLSALAVILTNCISYSFPIMGSKITLGLGSWVLFLIGMIFGPLAGVLSGICTDSLGSLINITGAYHLGYVLVKCLLGFGGSLVFFFKNYKWWVAKALVLFAVSYALISLVLNPIWNYSLGWGQTVYADMAIKFIKLPVELVIYSVLLIAGFATLVSLMERWCPTSIWVFERNDISTLLEKRRLKKLAKEFTTKNFYKGVDQHETDIEHS